MRYQILDSYRVVPTNVDLSRINFDLGSTLISDQLNFKAKYLQLSRETK